MASTRTLITFIASSLLFSLVQFKTLSSQYLTLDVVRDEINASVDGIVAEVVIASPSTDFEPNPASSPQQQQQQQQQQSSLRANTIAKAQVNPVNKKMTERQFVVEDDPSREFAIAFEELSEKHSEDQAPAAVSSSSASVEEEITETPAFSEDSSPEVAAGSEKPPEIVSEDQQGRVAATEEATKTPPPDDLEESIEIVSEDQQLEVAATEDQQSEVAAMEEANKTPSPDDLEEPIEIVSEDQQTQLAAAEEATKTPPPDDLEESIEIVSEDQQTQLAAAEEATKTPPPDDLEGSIEIVSEDESAETASFEEEATETPNIARHSSPDASDSFEELPENIVSEDTDQPLEHQSTDDDDDHDDYDRKRAIVLISTGEKAANTTLVERFVWSARNIGNYRGWIVLITDAEEERYANLGVAAMPTTDRTMTNHKSHVPPRTLNNTAAAGSSNDLDTNEKNRFLVFRTPEERFANITNFEPFSILTMNSKVYKTYILEYANLEPRLHEIELFYYLDVDIVFGNPIEPLFVNLEPRYKIGRLHSDNKNNYNTKPTIHFFKGNGKNRIQGGQFILDRTNSQPCLERWRELMQLYRNEKYQQDQDTLTIMLDEQETRNSRRERDCEIVRMKQDPKLIQFPEQTDMEQFETSPSKYPALVHFRNSAKAMKKVSELEFNRYLRSLLRIEHDENDEDNDAFDWLMGKMYMDKSPKKPEKRKKRRGKRKQPESVAES